MVATTATITALMKEVYEPRIELQYNTEKVALKRIESSSEGVTSRIGGKYVDFPIVTGRNSGIGYRDENEALQDPGQASYEEVHVALFYGYLRGHFTGQAIRLAKGNPQSFASAFDKEMDIARESVVKDANRIAYGNGIGVVATVNGAPAGNVITVNNTQYLQPGMKLTSHDVATNYNQTNTGGTDAGPPGNTYKVMTVVGVTHSTTGVPGGTVTVDSAAGVATTNALARPRNLAPGTTVRGKEPYGLGAIVSNIPLYGLDPATVPIWQGNIRNGTVPGTPEDLTEMKMIALCDQVRRMGGKVSLILTSLGARRSYFKMLVGGRQFHNTQEFAGGFTGLPFSYGTTIPLIEDVDAPPNTMWFIDESRIKEYKEESWHFADEDGNTLKYVIGYDKWEYLMRQYWNLGTSQRNAHAVLKDVKEEQ